MKEINAAAQHGLIHRVTSNWFRYNAWPTIARDENGTLYTVCSAFRATHICPFGKTAMFISKDDGKTWSKPIVINDTNLDDRDAGIVYMGNGKMLVSWFTIDAKVYQTEFFNKTRSWSPAPVVMSALSLISGYSLLDEKDQIGGSYVIVSEDYGMTWTEPIMVPITAPHGPSLCADGSLIYLGKEKRAEGAIPKGSINTYRSSDNGYTWEHLATLPIPDHLSLSVIHEPHVIELTEGKLLGAVRISGEHEGREYSAIYTTRSDDGGITWSEMTDMGIIGFPPHLMKHSSGAVICSYGRRTAPFTQRAAVSYDNGITWSEEYVLNEAPDSDLGYPASVELGDGSILTVYYQKCRGDGYPSIHCSRWSLGEKQ